MTEICRFNTTLFELTDELIDTIQPSMLVTTAYGVFKQMVSKDPDTNVALTAFWEVAQGREDMIRGKDVSAMADVLRPLIPAPGLVDDVLNKLSEENRGIVGDYLVVLFDQAKSIMTSDSHHADASAVAEVKQETDNGVVYSMYNDTWQEFLLHVINAISENDRSAAATKRSLQQGLDKLSFVLREKGAHTSMVYAVLFPQLEKVLPGGVGEGTDIVKLCMPPTNPVQTLKRDMKVLGTNPFPFERDMQMSTILSTLCDCRHGDTRNRLATYWHYLKLLTMCLRECPPEMVGVMSQVASLFRHDSDDARFLRDKMAVLTR